MLQSIIKMFGPFWVCQGKNKVRVPRRDNYENRPVLSATIHPDIKKTLVSISERTGMSVSQVTDEVLYTGLVEMYELDEL